jgi:hypothetical protein
MTAAKHDAVAAGRQCIYRGEVSKRFGRAKAIWRCLKQKLNDFYNEISHVNSNTAHKACR